MQIRSLTPKIAALLLRKASVTSRRLPLIGSVPYRARDVEVIRDSFAGNDIGGAGAGTYRKSAPGCFTRKAFGTYLADCASYTSMPKKYSIANHLAGTVHIDHATGALSWDQNDLDPVIQSYVKKYLFDEGFIEEALGMLDPRLDRQVIELLKSLNEGSD